jgi:hypothetical protein
MTDIQTQKLLKRFPCLYQEYYSTIRESAMPWGFTCGSGWYKIIWQLSLAIDDALGYSWLTKKRYLLLRKVSRKWNDFIYWLSPVKKKDILARAIGRLFPSSTQVKDHWPTSTLYWWSELGFKRFSWRPFTGISAGQVKEKFGTLRFYCPLTPEIEEYVELAERLSAVTCEVCGNCGKIRDGVHVMCLCDACAMEFGYPASEEEEDE